MACVGNDDDLRAVCLGPDGAFAGMAAGAVFVDHTTVSAEVTRELGPSLRGRAWVSSMPRCPAGRRGPKTACCPSCAAAREADYARAEPVMQTYARICKRLGGPGAGNWPR